MARYRVVALLLGLVAAAGTTAAARESPTLSQAVRLYQSKQYQEAIPLLQQALREAPSSTSASFFLGMAYKQTGDYELAARYLRQAITGQPRIKEALIELIEVLYRRPTESNIEEAMQWVALAERERIFPAKALFLKGLLLQHQGRTGEAVAAFDRAKELDPSLAQSADLQAALTMIKERNLDQAKVRLQTAIQQAPQSDLADFARQYLDVVEKRIELERPLRVSISLLGQYDTNVILAPLDSAAAGTSITDTESFVTAASLKVNYLPRLNGPWLLNAQYSLYGNLHERFSTSQDLLTNSLYLAPGYNFGTWSLNFKVDYANAMVRDPSRKQYLDSLTVGPFARKLFGRAHLAEIFAGYGVNDYAKPPLTDIEDRDSEGLRAGASWIWIYTKDGFFNLRYDFDRNHTDGANWDKEGHKFTASLSYPLRKKLSLQLGAQAYLEDYSHRHSVFGVTRDDERYQGNLGLSWEFAKATSLITQYTAIRQNSNIPIYDYRKELYTVGIEYRF